MSQNIIVGISDYKVAKLPQTLVTYALGSCVGICLYDDQLKVGGLAHIMLPDSTQFSDRNTNRMKYADTAIPDMLKELQRLGTGQLRLTAQIAGGAKMFQTQTEGPLSSIGDRNVDSVKAVLNQLRIPIIKEETRKNFGRTIYFDLNIGIMDVKSLQMAAKTL